MTDPQSMASRASRVAGKRSSAGCSIDRGYGVVLSQQQVHRSSPSWSSDEDHIEPDHPLGSRAEGRALLQLVESDQRRVARCDPLDEFGQESLTYLRHIDAVMRGMATEIRDGGSPADAVPVRARRQPAGAALRAAGHAQGGRA